MQLNSQLMAYNVKYVHKNMDAYTTSLQLQYLHQMNNTSGGEW
jgi:hypothetical protein